MYMLQNVSLSALVAVGALGKMRGLLSFPPGRAEPRAASDLYSIKIIFTAFWGLVPFLLLILRAACNIPQRCHMMQDRAVYLVPCWCSPFPGSARTSARISWLGDRIWDSIWINDGCPGTPTWDFYSGLCRSGLGDTHIRYSAWLDSW